MPRECCWLNFQTWKQLGAEELWPHAACQWSWHLLWGFWRNQAMGVWGTAFSCTVVPLSLDVQTSPFQLVDPLLCKSDLYCFLLFLSFSFIVNTSQFSFWKYPELTICCACKPLCSSRRSLSFTRVDTECPSLGVRPRSSPRSLFPTQVQSAPPRPFVAALKVQAESSWGPWPRAWPGAVALTSPAASLSTLR